MRLAVLDEPLEVVPPLQGLRAGDAVAVEALPRAATTLTRRGPGDTDPQARLSDAPELPDPRGV